MFGFALPIFLAFYICIAPLTVEAGASERKSNFVNGLNQFTQSAEERIELSSIFPEEWQQVCFFQDTYATLDDEYLSQLFSIEESEVIIRGERPRINGVDWTVIFFESPNTITSFNFRYSDLPVLALGLPRDKEACLPRSTAAFLKTGNLINEQQAQLLFSSIEFAGDGKG